MMKRQFFISALAILALIGTSVPASADSRLDQQARAKASSRSVIVLAPDVFDQSFTSERRRQSVAPALPSSLGYLRGNFDRVQDMAAIKVSASQAKAIALRHVSGSKYYDIKLIDGMIYRVRVEKNGRRMDVYVDGNTGRVR